MLDVGRPSTRGGLLGSETAGPWAMGGDKLRVATKCGLEERRLLGGPNGPIVGWFSNSEIDFSISARSSGSRSEGSLSCWVDIGTAVTAEAFSCAGPSIPAVMECGGWPAGPRANHNIPNRCEERDDGPQLSTCQISPARERMLQWSRRQSGCGAAPAALFLGRHWIHRVGDTLRERDCAI